MYYIIEIFCINVIYVAVTVLLLLLVLYYLLDDFDLYYKVKVSLHNMCVCVLSMRYYVFHLNYLVFVTDVRVSTT